MAIQNKTKGVWHRNKTTHTMTKNRLKKKSKNKKKFADIEMGNCEVQDARY